MTFCIYCYRRDDGDHACGYSSVFYGVARDAEIGLGIAAFFFGMAAWSAHKEERREWFLSGYEQGQEDSLEMYE